MVWFCFVVGEFKSRCASFARSYSAQNSYLFPGDFTFPFTETLITDRYSRPKTEYIVDYKGPWYIVFDHRAKGGRTPDPGSTVTIAWDDFQWVTNNGDPWPFTSSCGSNGACRYECVRGVLKVAFVCSNNRIFICFDQLWKQNNLFRAWSVCIHKVRTK